MKTDRKKLIEVLARVQPGLASKEVIAQSNSFVFQDGIVYTYNDEVAVQCPVKVDFNGAVKADELFKLLNMAKGEWASLSREDDELLIKAGRTKAGIRIEKKITLPLEELGSPKSWKTLNPKAFEAIEFCMFSVSRDMSKPVLTCVNIQGNKIESSDGYRATNFFFDGDKGSFPSDDNLMIPGSSCVPLVKYSGMHRYSITKGWVHFKDKHGVIFSCRCYSDNYPSIDKLFSSARESVEQTVELPVALLDAIQRASIMTKDKDILKESVELKFNRNQLTVRGEGDVGWVEERIKLKEPIKGDSFSFAITPKFLLDMLFQTGAFDIGEDRLLFHGEGWSHLMMLKEKAPKTSQTDEDIPF